MKLMQVRPVTTNLTKTMVYMPEELKGALVIWADKENRSLSNLIVTLLQESVREAKSKGEIE